MKTENTDKPPRSPHAAITEWLVAEEPVYPNNIFYTNEGYCHRVVADAARAGRRKAHVVHCGKWVCAVNE
jgi:hypothetical protein